MLNFQIPEISNETLQSVSGNASIQDFVKNSINETLTSLEDVLDKIVNQTIIENPSLNVVYIETSLTSLVEVYNCENDNFCMVKFSAGPPYGFKFNLRGYCF